LTGLPGAQQCTCFSQSVALAIFSFINVKTAALWPPFLFVLGETKEDVS
jgi:hypothetical protein